MYLHLSVVISMNAHDKMDCLGTQSIAVNNTIFVASLGEHLAFSFTRREAKMFWTELLFK